MSSPYKTFSYFTFGCKVNFADSSMIARQLVDFGCSQIHDDINADICIINTCSVTDLADRKAQKLIKKIRNEECLTQFIPFLIFRRTINKLIRDDLSVITCLQCLNRYTKKSQLLSRNTNPLQITKPFRMHFLNLSQDTHKGATQAETNRDHRR